MRHGNHRIPRVALIAATSMLNHQQTAIKPVIITASGCHSTPSSAVSLHRRRFTPCNDVIVQDIKTHVNRAAHIFQRLRDLQRRHKQRRDWRIIVQAFDPWDAGHFSPLRSFQTGRRQHSQFSSISRSHDRWRGDQQTISASAAALTALLPFILHQQRQSLRPFNGQPER